MSFIGILGGIYAMQPVLPPARAAEPTPAPVPVEAGAQRRFDLTVTLLVNGSSVGDITVNTDVDGNARIDVARLRQLVGPIVSTAVLDGLAARAAGDGMASLSLLNAEDFKIAFDLTTLRVLVEIPIDARAVNTISMTDNNRFGRADLTQPANVSTGVTFNIANRFQHLSDFGDIERDRFTMLAEGFVNVGGVNGVNLTFQSSYREGGRVIRQRTTLFHDDVTRAIRYAAGDLDPQTFGAYAAPVSMLGIGIERLYQEIQPYRNLRPAGRGSLVIERPSRVDVLVNGVIYRTLTLAPGQYNIRDFPFLDGQNDVQLVVRDDAGREESINLSFFTDTELLSPDLSIFSASIGFRRDRFGSFNSTSYEDTPVFNGFYRRGITDRLTLGGAVQLDRRNALVSGQIVIGTNFGLFGFEAALDANRDDKAQASYVMSYRLRRQSEGGRLQALDFNLQYQDAGFSPMEDIGIGANRFSYEANARYQASLGESSFLTLGASYAVGRGLQQDVRSANMGISRRFGRVNLGFNYAYREESAGSDHRFGLTLSVPLSRRQSLRAGYESGRNRVFADYDLNGFEGLNETSARVSLSREDGARYAGADIDHFSNRFRAFLRHSYSEVAGTRAQFTDIGASMGIGYADGQVAIGRDAHRGFAVVAGHSTLKNSPITAYSNLTLGPAAKTGALGPALVPNQRPYQPNSIRVEVANLPTGYDIGPGRYDIRPGAASGYAIVIGSALSKTVMGRLVDAAGEPIGFVSGTLVPVSGKDAQPTTFFTNRTGRMAASRVAPGRYRVVLAGKTEPIGEIDVPEDGEAMVNIGELRAGGSR